MKDEEILKAAIEKAWGKIAKSYWEAYYDGGGYVIEFQDRPDASFGSWNDIIFSHGFAKAFWGDEEVKTLVAGLEKYCGWTALPAWKHHLQIMVLQEEPLLYLEQFLTKEE